MSIITTLFFSSEKLKSLDDVKISSEGVMSVRASSYFLDEETREAILQIGAHKTASEAKETAAATAE